MKLSTNILLRILIPVAILIATWTIGFYFAILGEVNDEVDDALEEFADDITRRHLAGEPMPEGANGTNNSYHIEPIGYGAVEYTLRYSDEDVWIDSKNEWEPARVLRTTFIDGEGRGYMLTVLTPTIEKKDLKEALWMWAVMLCGLLLILIVIIVVAVLRRSLRPLHKLLGWLSRNRLDEEQQPLDNPTNIIEFKQLNEAAIAHERENRRLFEQQKEFVGNASHEIQTPLAICASRLEMLADTELSEAQLGEVLKLQNTVEHLSRLNSSLLLLTKIESGQFHETESVDVGALISSKIGDLEDIYERKQIEVEIVRNGQLIVDMNRTLAEIATTNLLKNAFLHNTAGGRIVVRIDQNGFVVCNSGQDKPLDSERVFTRFYQSAKREGSTGLGLAITASVARLYGYETQYSFENGLHCFAIRRVRNA